MFSSPRRGLAAAAAVAAILVLSPVLPAAASLGQSDRHGPAGGSDGTDVVTLITGDVVRVTHLAGGREAAAIEQPASGGVQILTVGRDLYAIPDAARPYLAADRLDRRLFNVTELIEQGYDDASADGLPLIAEYAGKERAQAARRAPAGADKVRDLGSINAAALTTDDADRFWDVLTPDAAASRSLPARFTGGITKIWLDQKVEADLADSVPQVGAPAAWAAGYDGTGADVAVLDTGVDATHPDLAGRIHESVSFVPDDDTGDENGHGTHVASTIAGSGAASGGANKGVAPGADLLIGKVLDDFGSGQDSWVIDGMEWAAQRADVVSMSLGSPVPTDGTDPLSQAVNRLTQQTGALFVVAAGNTYSEFGVTAPGAADAALTVAAVDGLDHRADFSSMGPRVGDYALKPDISAPGVDVTAARSQAMSWGEGWYVPMDGTSMATPHVAGAAAIVAAKHPGWSPARIKDALMSS